MYERFTDQAKRVVALAQDEARSHNHDRLNTEHFLLALIREGEGIGPQALESLGISSESVRRQIGEIIQRGERAPSGHIPFTPRAKNVLKMMLREATLLGDEHIGTEHILLGLIREGDGVAAQVLVGLGGNLERVREQVDEVRAVAAKASFFEKASRRTETGARRDTEGRKLILTHEDASLMRANPDIPWSQYTNLARQVVFVSRDEASSRYHDHIGTEHILLALIHERGGVAARTIESLGITIDGARQQVGEIIGRGRQAPRGHISFTQRARKVLELSQDEALQLGHSHIDAEHILLGLIREGESAVAQILIRPGGNLDRARRQVMRLLGGDYASRPQVPPNGANDAARSPRTMTLSDSVYERLLQQRIIVLGQQVDDDIANRIAAQMLLLSADNPTADISLHINSPGGSVTAGMAIFDTMEFIECDVATYATGLAAGMGQFLLAAGARGKRYALRNCQILMRQPSAGVGGTESDIVIQAELARRYKREMAELIARHTGQTVERILTDFERGERWFSAEEALEYGIVDHIIDRGRTLT